MMLFSVYGSPKAESRDREPVALLRIEQRYRTLRTAFRTGGGAFAVWNLYRLTENLAGKTTAVSVGLSFLWDFRLFFAISLAGFTTFWALAERSLRQRKVEWLQGRIGELETKIDPGRSTSGLTPKGKTNPRDRG